MVAQVSGLNLAGMPGTDGRLVETSINSAAEVSAASMVSPGTYVVTATREGLVGGTTSSGHVIVPDDHFASLPACLASNCPWLKAGVRHPTWGLRTECGDKCYVRVVNPANNRCQVAKVLDVGPWFRVDDWWNTSSRRHLNNLPTTKNILAQGYTGSDAARNGLDVGYGVSSRGIGSSDKYYEVGNRAALDLGDGTWVDLGLDFNRGIASGIQVSMLWQTGQDPAAAARACNQGTVPEPGTPSAPNASMTLSPTSGQVGSSTTVSASGFRAGEQVRVYWDSTSNTPLLSRTASSSGSINAAMTIPEGLGGTHAVIVAGASSGVQVYADYNVRPSLSRTPYEGTPGTRVAVTVHGFHYGETVQLNWNNASGPSLGTVRTNSQGMGTVTITIPQDSLGWHDYTGYGQTSRLRAYGAIRVLAGSAATPTPTPKPTTTPTPTPTPKPSLGSGTANPQFSGSQQRISASTGTSGATSSTRVHDGSLTTSWDLVTGGSTAGGYVTIDLGAVRSVSGVKWVFRHSGGADRMVVATSTDNVTWRTAGTYGNAPANSWHGAAIGQNARYVRFSIANPNGDKKIGYLAEVQVWGAGSGGTQAPTTPADAASNADASPSFGGDQLAIDASTGTSGATSSTRVHDGSSTTSWDLVTGGSTAGGYVRLDLGTSQRLTGVQWVFRHSGGADRMVIETSTDGGTWSPVGTFGNGTARTWYGVELDRSARFVRFTISNPNGDRKIGYLAEVQIWGTSTFSAARTAALPVETVETFAPEGTPAAATPGAAESAAESVAGTPVALEGTTETVASPTAVVETVAPTDSATEPTTEPTEEATSTPDEVIATGTIVGTDGAGAICRAGPSRESERLANLPDGTTVEVTGEPVDGFVPVRCGETAGYVFASLVDLGTGDSADATAVPTEAVTGDAAVGTDGEPGEPGDPGEPGEPGEPGRPGEPGEDGLAAMETTVSEPTPEVVVRELVVPVSSDTSISADNPDTPQPGEEIGSLTIGGPEGSITALTFNVDGIEAGTVVDARLVLTGAASTGSGGGTLSVLPNVWIDEAGATYAAVLAAGPATVGEVAGIAPGAETTVDVTGVVTSDGTVTFVLVGTSAQTVVLASAEAGSPARLVLTIEEWVLPEGTDG